MDSDILVNGDYVLLNTDVIGIVVDGTIVYQDSGWDTISALYKGLKFKNGDYITKIYRSSDSIHSFNIARRCFNNNRDLIYREGNMVKKMTLSEIEEELGYKIEIIDQNS